MTRQMIRSEAAKASLGVSCTSTVIVPAEGRRSNQQLPALEESRSQVSRFDLRLPRVSSSA